MPDYPVGFGFWICGRTSLRKPCQYVFKSEPAYPITGLSGNTTARNDYVTITDDDDEESDAQSWVSEDDPDRLWCICQKPHNNRYTPHPLVQPDDNI